MTAQPEPEQHPLEVPLLEVLGDLRTAGAPLVYSEGLVSGRWTSLAAARSMLEGPGDLERVRKELARVDLGILVVEAEGGERWVVARLPERKGDPGPDEPQRGNRPPEVMAQASDSIVVLAPWPAWPEASVSDEQAIATPGITKDPVDLAKREPRLRQGQLSAVPALRGLSSGSVGVSIDGFELTDPYHLSEFDKPLSFVPSAVVTEARLRDAANLRTADRLGGVLDLSTRGPRPESVRTRATLGPLLASVVSQGPGLGAEDRWVASGRAGLLSQVAALADVNERPLFWDLFAEYDWQLGDRRSLELRGLAARDQLEFATDGRTNGPFDIEDFRSNRSSTYAWATLSQVLGSATVAETLLGWGNRDESRSASTASADRVFSLLADSSLRVVQAHQLVSHQGPKFLLEGGFEYRFYKSIASGTSELGNPYDFIPPANGPVLGKRAQNSRAKTEQTAAFFSTSFERWDRISVRAGLRFEASSRERSESSLTPRVAVVWQLPNRSALHASYARTSQTQQPHELQLIDGATEFADPERGDDWSLQWRSSRPSHSLTAGLFHRRISNPRSRFVNLLDRYGLVPELQPDRVQVSPLSSRASGLELSARWRTTTTLEVAARGGVSRHRFGFSGFDSPAPEDQLADFELNGTYRPNPRWSVAAGWRFASGLPTTGLATSQIGAERVEFGPVFERRLPSTRHFDLGVRYQRSVSLGTLSFSLDVENLTNRRHVRGFRFAVDSEPRLEPRFLPGILPSFTIGLEF